MAMLKLQIALSIAAVILYLLIVGSAWIEQAKRQEHNNTEKQSYFWGLLFSAAFYLSLPIFLFRYGLKTTGKLILGCAGVFAIAQGSLYAVGADGLGLVIMLIVRAGGGVWIAKHDPKLRNSAIAVRQAPVAEKI